MFKTEEQTMACDMLRRFLEIDTKD